MPQVVTGLSPWKSKFNPRLVNVGFVVTFQILEHELTMESIRLYSQSLQCSWIIVWYMMCNFFLHTTYVVAAGFHKAKSSQ